MRSLLCFSLFILSLQAAQVQTLTTARNPYGLVIGPDQALYICEIDAHQVTRFDLKTHQSTAIGPFQQPYEIRFDRSANLWVDDMPAHAIFRVDAKTKAIMPVVTTGLKQPHSIAFAPDGGLLICDIGNKRIKRLDTGTAAVEPFGEPMNGPRAIAFAPDGTMYVVLREGNAVFRMDVATKRLTPFAGTGEKGYSGDNGPALAAQFNGPKGIAAAPDGSLYIADTENHVIRRIDTKGRITTVLGSGVRGDGPDGDPLGCALNRPHGVFVAADGTVYVGDSESNKVRILR